MSDTATSQILESAPVRPPTLASETDPERIKQLLDAMVPPFLELLEHYAAQDVDWAAHHVQALERLMARRRVRPHPLTEALERTGGVYEAETAQRLLGVKRQSLYNRRRDHRILSLRGKDDAFVYPQIQFVEAADPERPIRVHPNLHAILREGGMLTPTELFIFLATPQPSFDDQTGWELMHAGRAREVVALLRHVRGGAPGDEGHDVVQDLPADLDAVHDKIVLQGANPADRAKV